MPVWICPSMTRVNMHVIMCTSTTCVNVDCYWAAITKKKKKSWTECFLNTGNFFLTVRVLRSSSSRSGRCVSGKGSRPWCQTAVFFAVSSHGRSGEGTPGVYKGAYPIHESSPVMAQAPPKALSFNPVWLGAGVHKQSVCSTV